MIERKIIDIAVESGATLAGIAAMEDVRSSSSHLIYPEIGSHSGVDTTVDGDTHPDQQPFIWVEPKGSILVVGLSHPEDQPELDWWDGRGTPGNRRLIDILERTRQQIESRLQVRTRSLHYYVEKGGVFLKDAAVLAGLGCIGKNNMLVAPDYGPRVRLRALFLDSELRPTGPVAFDPCADCTEPCRRVCPEKALEGKTALFASLDISMDLPARDGTYDRDSCNRRMLKDDFEGGRNGCGARIPVKYCRRCEFACPVGTRAGWKR